MFKPVTIGCVIALLLPLHTILAQQQCSASVSCADLGFPGYCCSNYGYCGTTAAYCSPGNCLADCSSTSTTSTTATTATTSPAVTTATTSTTASSATTGNGVSDSPRCSGSYLCSSFPGYAGTCCSQYGYCGSDASFCGTGCVSGACWTTTSSTTSSTTSTSSSTTSATTSTSSTTTSSTTTGVSTTGTNSGTRPTPTGSLPSKIFLGWYVGNQGTNWGEPNTYDPSGMYSPDDITASEVQWMTHRGDGNPTFNVVSFAFINPMNLINQINDGASTNGVPIGMINALSLFPETYIFFSLGGNAWSAGSGTEYFKEALAQNATLFGQIAAAVANEYQVGFEIDNEADDIDFSQLDEFVATYRANTANWLTMDSPAETPDGYLPQTTQKAVDYLASGQIDWINAMVSAQEDLCTYEGYWDTWHSAQPTSGGEVDLADKVVISTWSSWTCTSDKSTGCSQTGTFLADMMTYATSGDFLGIAFWALGAGLDDGQSQSGCTVIQSDSESFVSY